MSHSGAPQFAAGVFKSSLTDAWFNEGRVSRDWDMAKILFWDWELLFLFSGILGNDHLWDWDFREKHTWDWEFLTFSTCDDGKSGIFVIGISEN